MMKMSVSIDVPDLKKGEAFYMQALGCKKVREQGENMTVLSTDNAEIYLLACKDGSHPVKAHAENITRNYQRHWMPVHIDFLCEDVSEVVARVQKHGGTHEGGEGGAWGAIAYCADPFGNGFCVINE